LSWISKCPPSKSYDQYTAKMLRVFDNVPISGY
jgi:hypothetical protein